MGEYNGTTAKLWIAEFQKGGITGEDLNTVANNLGDLVNPQFIPNAFQLIELHKKMSTYDEHQINSQMYAPVSLPKPEEVTATREETQTMREECLDTIAFILKADRAKPAEEKSKSRISEIMPGPSDRMVRLIHNHNRLLLSQGAGHLNMPWCKKRAAEMGL